MMIIMTTDSAAPSLGLDLISPTKEAEMLIGRREKLFISSA